MTTTYSDLTDYTDPTEEQLLRDYTDAWQAIEQQLARVVARVERAERGGLSWSDAWASQQVQLGALLHSIEVRVQQIAGAYPDKLEARRRSIVARGVKDAEAQLAAVGVGSPSVPVLTFERLAYKRNLDALFQNLGDVAGKKARQVLLAGMAQGQGPRTVARGLARVMNGNMVRAQTIARTEMLQTYREASLETYRENGTSNGGVVEAWNWVAEPDACEICEAAAEDSPYQLDQDFDTHPNAVLAGSTFRPYGRLREMVAARYSGPSVALTTDTGELTIGPNHPMLTRTGWIRAGDLHEGDQLVYDPRHEYAVSGSEADFEQVPLVEDVFETVSSLGVHSRIAASAGNLHGDGRFCQGEVDVIRATDRLLIEADAPFKQHRRKCQLMWANPGLKRIASLSPAFSALEAIYLSTSSFMRGSRSRLALVGADAGCPCEVSFPDGSRYPARFYDVTHSTATDPKLLRYGIRAEAGQVEPCDLVGADVRQAVGGAIARLERPTRLHVETDSACVALDLDGHPFSLRVVTGVQWGWFSGMAYDASTSSGLYASGGYCIKNCRCYTEPVTVDSTEVLN